MDALLAARAQMELSLGFHMVFAALGIGMPVLLLLAEGLYLRTGAPRYLALARTWGKATALLFAVGAVSGTALSFELGLLWPRLMATAGGVLGPAFALEGYAFFIEAIFIGLYLYGWERLSPRAHFWTGVPVAVSGLASGVLVVAANAWMQHPGGPPELAPATAVFGSPLWLPMALHSSLACYAATGFAVAGVYAAALLRGPGPEAGPPVAGRAERASPGGGGGRGAAGGGDAGDARDCSHVADAGGRRLVRHLHPPPRPRRASAPRAASPFVGGDGDHPAYCRSGLRIAAGVGAAAALLQLLSGDHSARSASRFQPHKLAAMEAVFHTTRGAPLLIGGLPDEAAGRVRYGLELPRGLSLLVAHDPDALVRGLDELPRADRPPVVLTHLAFQTMVGCGFALVGISLLFLLGRLRRREEGPRLLRLVLLGSPLGLLALEAGWVVTEAGRQPWVIYERLRTADAVTPVGGGTVAFSLAVFTLLYLGLGAALVALLRWLARDAPGAAHA